MDSSSNLLGLAAVTSSILFYSWYSSRRSVPLPPGPKGHWLLGSASDIASASQFWCKLAEYTDQYGPLVIVRLLHQRVFVVSDPRIVIELFEKRAANYSGRDNNEMIKLRYRALLTRALNSRVSQDYIPLQKYEVQRFLKRLSNTPEHFMSHAYILSASIAVRIAYGYKVESSDDPFLVAAEQHAHSFNESIKPWGWFVNAIPLLRYLPDWLPITPFQRHAIKARKIIRKHQEEPFKYVQEQMAKGTAEDSFAFKLLQSEDGKPVSEETQQHVKSIAASFYSAGSDTTASIIKSFFLAMSLYPKVQAKAQTEVTSYLAQNPHIRMILPIHKKDLPYTSAIIRELLRWHPVGCTVAHKSGDEDDDNVVTSDGKRYRIPAQSLVISNVWQIMHDPNVYPDPEEFKPERWLVADPPPDSEKYAFGFGRRICPGMYISQQSMWITISNVLANFTVSKAKDESGNEITPEEIYANEIISHPLAFRCAIIPREGFQDRLKEMDA